MNDNIVLARKYRPKKFEEVVGQPTVVQTLSNALQKNNLHHAYLFVGSFGSGKTSVSRILAASENCLDSPGLHPCGRCSLCTRVFEGKHTDILEIDAASNAGKVEQIRELKNSALYNPIEGAKTKYFIIDEVHRASDAASEALLKIIEEPPPNVRFILCTTEAQKVTGTIISRCQKHEFRKIYWTIILDHLIYIAKEEKAGYEEGALKLCARLASGSMRNALQYLEHLIDFAGGEEITEKIADKVFGTVSETRYYDLLDQILGTHNEGKADASKGFKIINKMVADGVDFNIFCDEISEHFRNIMIGLTAKEAGDLISFSTEGKKRFQAQLNQCKQGKKLTATIECIRLLNEAKEAVQYGISEEIALQMWLVESIFTFRQS